MFPKTMHIASSLLSQWSIAAKVEIGDYFSWTLAQTALCALGSGILSRIIFGLMIIMITITFINILVNFPRNIFKSMLSATRLNPDLPDQVESKSLSGDTSLYPVIL